ncbi:N-6 DNA methylase [Roseibium sp.]|uniref:N-6 DNA methylase n=1 Tax=Roseibium sp. TaxID=1936156 RepID=UPI003BAC5F51
MSLIRSKKRVADHGEVFTPPWLVEVMLNLVENEADRINSRFLEPACGSGNFLVQVLRRKLAAVEMKYGRSDFDRKHFALYGLMSIYGIELLEDNISECHNNIIELFAEYLGVQSTEEFCSAASAVLSLNLVHGDALSMRAIDGSHIVFSEWGYLGRGKFQRRDFRLESLTRSADFHSGSLLNVNPGKHELFTPVASFPPMKVREIAELGSRLPKECA